MSELAGLAVSGGLSTAGFGQHEAPFVPWIRCSLHNVNRYKLTPRPNMPTPGRFPAGGGGRPIGCDAAHGHMPRRLGQPPEPPRAVLRSPRLRRTAAHLLRRGRPGRQPARDPPVVLRPTVGVVFAGDV